MIKRGFAYYNKNSNSLLMIILCFKFWPTYAYHVIIGRLNTLCCHLVFVVVIIVRRCFHQRYFIIFLFCKQQVLSQTGKAEKQVTECEEDRTSHLTGSRQFSLISMMNTATIKPVILAVLPLRSQELQVFMEAPGEMEDTREGKEN